MNAVVVENIPDPLPSFVNKVEKVRQYKVEESKLANDLARKQGSTFPNQLSHWQHYLLNADCLHSNNKKGQGINIAVFDAGFTKVDSLEAFKSLFAGNLLKGSFDLVDHDNDPFHASPHGTYVLSIMAASIFQEFTGTSPEANYFLFRTEDTSGETLQEEYNWILAAEMADSLGVDIINSSLGYTTFEDSLQNHTYEDMDGNTAPISIAADIAASKGILVISSAGNYGNGNWKYISAPADGDSVLTVGAVDSLRGKSAFSSFGPTYDQQIKPEVCALGSGVYVVNTNGGVVSGNGTSFSAPLIAGMAACLWQTFPSMSNMEILEAIKRSADQYHFPDTLKGYGVPDFCKASFYLSGLELEKENTLFVAPNPFTDSFYLYSDDQASSFAIYDISGRTIYDIENLSDQPGETMLKIDYLESFPDGIYFLQYKNANNEYLQTIKIVKQQ